MYSKIANLYNNYNNTALKLNSSYNKHFKFYFISF